MRTSAAWAARRPVALWRTDVHCRACRMRCVLGWDGVRRRMCSMGGMARVRPMKLCKGRPGCCLQTIQHRTWTPHLDNRTGKRFAQGRQAQCGHPRRRPVTPTMAAVGSAASLPAHRMSRQYSINSAPIRAACRKNGHARGSRVRARGVAQKLIDTLADSPGSPFHHLGLAAHHQVRPPCGATAVAWETLQSSSLQQLPVVLCKAVMTRADVAHAAGSPR